jgi:glutamate formiminotransferase / 5-formyltetrahydrofolate cyclo-ligase
MVRTLGTGGTDVLDVHSDAVHHRSVLTVTGSAETLCTALAQLADATLYIRVDQHRGVHPRLGGLDVCPIVPHDAPMGHAVACAHAVGESIHDSTGLPIYFYGEAAVRDEARELPDIRRGGLGNLRMRAKTELPPDIGDDIDPRTGVVCVGARGPLIAFNVDLRAELSAASSLAQSLRESKGGLPGVRALAFPIDDHTSQISMNLTRPELAGIDAAFETIAEAAAGLGTEILSCEVVGLVPERFLPDPAKQAARLLLQPDRCLETRLPSSSS